MRHSVRELLGYFREALKRMERGNLALRFSGFTEKGRVELDL